LYSSPYIKGGKKIVGRKEKSPEKKFSLHIDVNCVCYFILKFKFDEVKSKKWTRKNKEDKKNKNNSRKACCLYCEQIKKH